MALRTSIKSRRSAEIGLIEKLKLGTGPALVEPDLILPETDSINFDLK